MATTTANFNLKKYEGTDLFNPLTFENPNTDDIDAAMYYNKQHICVDATELTTGTVHALTKTDTDSPLFSFTATSVYHAGDTFTLNGAAVTALLTSGETLPEGAYVIGSRVLGFVSGGGSLITFYVMKTTDLTPINSIIGNTDISGIGDGTLTGAVDEINDKLTTVAGATVVGSKTAYPTYNPACSSGTGTIDQVTCHTLSNGMRVIKGIFNITGDVTGKTILTLPNGYGPYAAGYSQQHWFTITNTSNNLSYVVIGVNNLTAFGTIPPVGIYQIQETY